MPCGTGRPCLIAVQHQTSLVFFIFSRITVSTPLPSFHHLSLSLSHASTGQSCRFQIHLSFYLSSLVFSTFLCFSVALFLSTSHSISISVSISSHFPSSPFRKNLFFPVTTSVGNKTRNNGAPVFHTPRFVSESVFEFFFLFL